VGLTQGKDGRERDHSAGIPLRSVLPISSSNLRRLNPMQDLCNGHSPKLAHHLLRRKEREFLKDIADRGIEKQDLNLSLALVEIGRVLVTEFAWVKRGIVDEPIRKRSLLCCGRTQRAIGHVIVKKLPTPLLGVRIPDEYLSKPPDILNSLRSSPEFGLQEFRERRSQLPQPSLQVFESKK
jgi:hypothetical protein